MCVKLCEIFKEKTLLYSEVSLLLEFISMIFEFPPLLSELSAHQVFNDLLELISCSGVRVYCGEACFYGGVLQ